ncbi:unnamed protein product [Rhizopus microsporus]
MTKESDDIVPVFNVSTLSSNYYFNCEKNYYLLPDRKKVNPSKEEPRNQSTKGNSQGNSQGNSSKNLAQKGGDKFENKIYKSLEDKKLLAKTHTDFRVALKEANSGKYLHNQTFTVDNTFYTKVIENGEVYRIANFKPDFVYFINQKTIRIIEVKSSEKEEETHKIQVVSYWLLIDHLIKGMDIVLDEQVGIWLPSDEENPKLFSVKLIIDKVKELYKTTLRNVIKSGEYKWDLQKKCRTCGFYERCKDDAKGTVKELPYNSKERYDYYKKYKLKHIKDIKNIEDIEDIEDLTVPMQRMKINEQYTSQQHRRIQGYADCRKYVDCRKMEEPIFFGFPTTLVSKKADHDIYVSFLKDGYTRYPYAFAFHISPDINLSKELTYCLNKSYCQKDEDQPKEAFCEITKRFIKALYSILSYMNDNNKSCLFYVYDNNEMYNIKNFLSELVFSQGKHLTSLKSTEKEDVVKKATKCLVALFQDGTLLDVPTLEELPCLDKIEKNAMTERFVVIEKLLEQNVALPAQVYYEVSDAVKWMVDCKAVVYNFEKEWEDFSKNNTGDDQFAKETKKKQLELLEQLQKVMKKYRNLANTTTIATTELFPLSCPVFKWPDTFKYNYLGCNNQMLAKILYFTEYIRLFKQREFQQALIADLDIMCGYKTSSKLSSLTLALNESGKFDVVITENEKDIDEKLESHKYDKANGYKHILVPNTYEDIVNMLKYMHNLEACEEKTEVKSRFRLYKIYEDKNENNPFKNMFKALDKATKDSIDNLLKDPNGWSTKDTFNDVDFNSSETKESLNKFSLLRSQQKAVKIIMERRLQLICGSDKVRRQFLAQFIHWYITKFVKDNRSKRLVIGVAANSNDSAFSLLEEVEKIQKESETIKSFSIIYVGKLPRELDANSNIKCTLQIDKDVTVVGARFPHWEYVKKWKDFSNCRMMIIDDGSNMYVHNALLPLGCLSSTRCKLIVAGDINYNQNLFSYGYYRTSTSGSAPLLYRSIQECLTRKECKYCNRKEGKCCNRKEGNVAIEIDGKKVNNLKNLGPNTLKLRNEV